MSPAVLMTAHRPTAADAPAPTGAAPYQMSFIRYHNQFTELHRQQHFSANAHLLFNILLGFFNDRRTDGQLSQIEEFADSFLCLATGLKSVNTLKPARAELVERRVLAYDDGGRSVKGGRPKKTDMGKYKLLRYREAAPGEAPMKLSKIDSLIDSFSAHESEKLSSKLSGKLSIFDTNYQKERGTENVTTEGRPAEKKMSSAGADFPDRGASHTGGGGPTDVGTSKARAFSDEEGLRPLRDDEQAHGPVIDERLPDSDAMKYAARPKDVQMVDAWLQGHPDPEISKHAGKGNLFFDYYEQYDWCNKHGQPIRNWRAAAKNFSFRDYKAENAAEAAARLAKVAAASGGQLQQRSAGVDEARAMFEALGQKGGTSE